jgi:hypothetical protein
MKKITSLLLCFIITIMSCEETSVVENNISPVSYYQAASEQQFAQALARALADNEALRKFIKHKALDQFDKDYDVLYLRVKDDLVDGEQNFRNILLTYFEDPNALIKIEAEYPLLTIFVPTLPEDSFSADKWNTETEIPLVALSMDRKPEISVVDAEGNTFYLKPNEVPAFPVVVLKNNERVILKKGGASQSANARTDNSSEFAFIDDAFDNVSTNKKKATLTTSRVTNELDQKLIDARNLGIEWPRDYIYYNLTPAKQRGAFSYDFQEHITSFKFNTAEGVKKIADQGSDPGIIFGGASGWTDGYFEFAVNVLINGRVTKKDLNVIFSAKGSDLFDVTYTKTTTRCGLFCKRTIYTISSITPLTVYPNIPLINWDLDNFASSMVVKFQEFDVSETISETIEVSSKFATNFELGAGAKEKVGFKFGASMEESTTEKHTRTYALNSDDLGEAIINFADKVIIDQSGEPANYRTREYSTGLVSFSVEPKRVQ